MDANTLFLKLFRCVYVSLEVSFVSFALFLTNLGVFKVSEHFLLTHPVQGANTRHAHFVLRQSEKVSRDLTLKLHSSKVETISVLRVKLQRQLSSFFATRVRQSQSQKKITAIMEINLKKSIFKKF